MSRKGTVEVIETTNMPLEELIPAYYFNKSELDSYKKIVDKYNGEIKAIMTENNQDKVTVGEYTATKSIATKETFDETKLIEALKRHKINGVIKVKEYIDFDALEDYLFVNSASPELAKDINDCKSTTEVIRLIVKKK